MQAGPSNIHPPWPRDIRGVYGDKGLTFSGGVHFPARSLLPLSTTTNPQVREVQPGEGKHRVSWMLCRGRILQWSSLAWAPPASCSGPGRLPPVQKPHLVLLGALWDQLGLRLHSRPSWKSINQQQQPVSGTKNEPVAMTTDRRPCSTKPGSWRASQRRLPPLKARYTHNEHACTRTHPRTHTLGGLDKRLLKPTEGGCSLICCIR